MAKRLKCSTPHCRRYAIKGRKICGTCKSRKSREANPIRYAYQTLKDNAKRRGHIFKISYEYFVAFCTKTLVLHGRGRTSESYHIDKIIDELGYVEGNIQVLTNRENVLKEHARRKAEQLLQAEKAELRQIKVYDWQTKTGRYIYRSNTSAATVDDCPF